MGASRKREETSFAFFLGEGRKAGGLLRNSILTVNYALHLDFWLLVFFSRRWRVFATDTWRCWEKCGRATRQEIARSKDAAKAAMQQLRLAGEGDMQSTIDILQRQVGR